MLVIAGIPAAVWRAVAAGATKACPHTDTAAVDRCNRGLAKQQSAAVSGPRVEGMTCRDRDFMRVNMAMTVNAEDPGQALTIAWQAFKEAVGEAIIGWDTEGASAEVTPA